MGQGRPAKIEGDPDSPVNKGVLCAKAMSSLEHLYHPERLRYPLRRLGNRGEGNWQRISWEEALEIIGKRFTSVKEEFGAESVVFIHGAAKGLQETYLRRLANVFGTPNVASMGYVCFLPRKFGSVMTFGFNPIPDYDYPPQCIIVWGSYKSKIAEYYKTLEAAKEKGAKLIVIDPRYTEFAQRADKWIRLRPSTDLALVLGMINVILNEGLYDEQFVEEWTIGFDELERQIRDYPPERVAEITWVAKDLIEEIARTYAARKPACIQMGNGLEHNINSFQTIRGISILKALTGNISVPGGEVYQAPLSIPDRYAPELTLDHMLPDEKKGLRLGSDNKFLPFYQYAHPPSVIRAMLEGRPYPVRAAYIHGANPLVTYGNAQETFKAFMGLDFLVVADLFLTPTAALADIVLPSATYLEFDSIVNPPYYPVAQVQQKVAEIEECWPDFRILTEMAKRMDLGEFFWENERGFLDTILEPMGINFDEFREIGATSGSKEYYHYKLKGFDTPSGKVELVSDRLREWGFDPLPVYREPQETPFSDPELAREYPLIFTSVKSEYYRHSGGRQIKTLRKLHPEPIVYIHPEAAAELGIGEGDWVSVATKRGSIRQKAVFSEEIDPKVVGVDYGWWFPEKGAEVQYGWRESNINILTDNKPPFNRELGTTHLRGILCKISKGGQNEGF